MSRYSLEEFVQKTSQKDQQQGLFELESSAMLEVNLRGQVWTKTGSMVAYQGGITFQREGMMEGGVGKAFKRALTGEGAALTKAQGIGRVYLADAHKKISILRLENQSLFVNGNDLLAFEDGLQWDIKMMRRMSSMMAGGLFNVKLEGTGLVAITSHGDPLTLRVGHNRTVVTDPNATVAWSGNLEPELKTDITVGTLFGRGGGEAFQLKFEGEDGFVVVQPYEELALQQGAGR
ncbi:AIM24 family protein [Archangium sp.]|jgi:uncharacterized protein (AIM24 family)|uniref:AIM24 family protein n=1 Tax=Archangium sp. TaxID=1872627 RepID=UPI002EDB85DE